MRIAWVNPAFSDYRVPVYRALDTLAADGLSVVFSRGRTSQSVSRKIADALGDRAVGLDGERGINLGAHKENFANVGFKLPYQPGLLRAIAAARPDVLVSEGFFQWTPAALWHKLRRRVPLVIAYERTAHTERNASRLRLGYRRAVARMADAIACNGRLSKEFCIRALGVPEDRIVTGAMAADTQRLSAQVDAIAPEARDALLRTLGAARPLFLYVGRLIRLKGLRELLQAWAGYERDGASPGTLLLVGDGPERPVLDAMVRDLALKHILFAGAVPYDDIAPYYAAADCLVMPTLEDNWSLVVPEAMACGLPILCSKYNGCWPELVHQDGNGWVFDPADTAELAALLRRVRDSRDRLPAMGAQSRAIIQDYTPEHAARAVLKACQIALGHA